MLIGGCSPGGRQGPCVMLGVVLAPTSLHSVSLICALCSHLYKKFPFFSSLLPSLSLLPRSLSLTASLCSCPAACPGPHPLPFSTVFLRASPVRRPSWAGGFPRRCEEGQGAPGLPPGSSPRGPRGRTAQEPASRLPLLAGRWGLPAKSRSLSRPNRVCSMYKNIPGRAAVDGKSNNQDRSWQGVQ